MQEFSLAQIMPLLPEIYLAIVSFLLLLAGVTKHARITPFMLASVVLLLIITAGLVSAGDPASVTVLNGMFTSNLFTRFAKLMVLTGASLVMLISSSWLTEHGGKPFEFLILVMLSVIGMLLLVSAGDLLALYVALELMSLALYVLASFERDHPKSSEAGLKYFVLGALASGMLLFGISLVYGFTGTINFDSLSQYFASLGEEGASVAASRAVVIGLVLIIIGFCFKLSAVPFHMWTPDVYEGAPTPVAAFFAVAPKIAGFALFLRVLTQPFGDLIDSWRQIIEFISVASMLVGALAALMQTNIKRLLAYSSIGHVGFMLMGLAAGTSAGIQGVLIYLALYIFMSAGAFGCVLLLKRNGVYLEKLSDFSGLSRSNPVLALAMAAFMFSMAGIPPMGGFFGKMYVIMAAMGNGLFTLAVIGLLTSVIACYYYLKVVKIMYFDAPLGALDRDESLLVRAGIGISALVTLFYVILPSPLIDHAKTAAESLLP